MSQCQPCPEGLPCLGTLITCPQWHPVHIDREEGQKRGSERRGGADTTGSAEPGPGHAQLCSALFRAD